MVTENPKQDAERTYFEEMTAVRRRVVRPLVLIVAVYYFTLPLLTNFTSALDGIAFEGMSWAYIYAFSQFVMVIVLTTYYRRVMDAAEKRLRPLDADEAAAHYDDWQNQQAEPDDNSQANAGGTS